MKLQYPPLLISNNCRALQVIALPVESTLDLVKRSPSTSNPSGSILSGTRRRIGQAGSYERVNMPSDNDIAASPLNPEFYQVDIEGEIEEYEQDRLDRLNVVLNDINIFSSISGFQIEDDMRQMSEEDREASKIFKMVQDVANDTQVQIPDTLQERVSNVIKDEYEKAISQLKALIRHCQIADGYNDLKEMVPHRHLNEVKKLAMRAITNLNLLRLHNVQLRREYNDSQMY